MPNTITPRVFTAGLIVVDGTVLMVEYFNDTTGLFYMLPGGAVQSRETIRESLIRELSELACVQVEVGPLLMAYEYAPHLDPIPRSDQASVTLVFACRMWKGKAAMPDCPDRDQTGVRWIPLDELDALRMVPPLQRAILNTVYNEKTPPGWIEEWQL